MKNKIQKIFMWIVLVATAVGAFTLTINITSDMIETTNESEDVVIDLNEDPAANVTTEEESFWDRYWKTKSDEKKTDTSKNKTTEKKAVTSEQALEQDGE